MFATQDFVVLTLWLAGLFLLPGLGATVLLFPRDDLDLLERLPLGFALGLGLLLIIFVLAMGLSWSWEAITAAWLGLALALTFGGAVVWTRATRRGPNASGAPLVYHKVATTAFLLALGLSAALTLSTPRDEDDWSYFKVIRTLADQTQIAPMSLSALRDGLNVWMFFHALIVHLLRADLVRLGQEVLPFLLVPLSLMALYGLAHALWLNRNQAFLAGVLQLAIYVPGLFYNDPNVQLTGGWVLGRIDQDHTAAQFIFLPVYMTLVLYYLRTGALRWLAAGFAALLVLGAVHPQGVGQAGIITAALVIVDLVVDRTREARKRNAVLLAPYLVLPLALIPFLSYWRGNVQTDPYSDLLRLAVGQTVFPFTFRWLTFLSPGSFILLPDLLGEPFLLAALVLTPFLIPHLRTDLAARYLFGLMLALLLILYTPPPMAVLAGGLGYSVYRLWFLFPCALVIAYWMPQLKTIWGSGFSELRAGVLGRGSVSLLLLAAGVLLVGSRFPLYVRGAPSELGVDHSLPSGAHEVLTALREQSAPAGGVVLAPRSLSDPIPAYRASLTPVLFRYNTPKELLDQVNEFYAAPVLTDRGLELIYERKASFLITPVDKENITQFDLSSRYFVALYRNSNWALYRVNPSTEIDDLVLANTLYMYGDWQEAIDTYNKVLVADPGNSLAHTGLGMILELLDRPVQAAAEFEAAVRSSPTNLQAHYHLARVYRKLGRIVEAKSQSDAARPLDAGPQ